MNEFVICPTVTAYNDNQYSEQLNKLASLTPRLHIDLMDGIFAPIKSFPIDKIHWNDELKPDVHFMYKQPLNYLDNLIKLKPRLIIVHLEAIIDHDEFCRKLKESGIKCGIALLQQTPVSALASVAKLYSHILIFSGNLGYHGGNADLNLLTKVKELKQLYPDKEIAWDGGINESNIKQINDSGVKVLNVGGYLSSDPVKAYAKLENILKAGRD